LESIVTKKIIKIRFLISLLAASMASACKPVESVKEVIYHGSIKGVEACMNTNATELLEKEQLRLICTTEHQRPMSGASNLNGNGYLSEEGLKANVTNKNEDRIITEITFIVEIYDENGKLNSYFLTADTWLPPNSTVETSAKFEIEPEANLQVPWCESAQITSGQKSCRDWGIVTAKAITF
jgi:uncharacterized membrane protein